MLPRQKGSLDDAVTSMTIYHHTVLQIYNNLFIVQFIVDSMLTLLTKYFHYYFNFPRIKKRGWNESGERENFSRTNEQGDDHSRAFV